MGQSLRAQGERGYIEGYYGQLLSWSQRRRLIDHLAALEFDTYFYAPKEDVCHRLNWRVPYSADWRAAFSAFCDYARIRGIKVVAGVAPGLDFDFQHLTPHQSDFNVLLAKSQQLVADGAVQLALLLDDIDEDFYLRCGDFGSEGTAHAELANQLADATGESLWVVPRVYAHEIAEESPGYLPDFTAQLHSQHTLVYCGTHTVAPVLNEAASMPPAASAHAVVFWDNLYANDYCPRRLFVGEWEARQQSISILLNPVGMIETDMLLLSIMSVGDRAAEGTATDRHKAWRLTMQEAGVPDAFFEIAPFFNRPPAPDHLQVTPMAFATAEQLAALEFLLWKWKTPLSREWYPYLMSLKHDLLLATDALPLDRIVKTQSNPLAMRLVKDSNLGD